MWFVLSTLNHPVSLQPVDRETNIGQTVDGTDPDESVMTCLRFIREDGEVKSAVKQPEVPEHIFCASLLMFRYDYTEKVD